MYNSLECLDNLKTCKEEDRRYHLQALANSLRELEGEKGDIDTLAFEVDDLTDRVQSLEYERDRHGDRVLELEITIADLESRLNATVNVLSNAVLRITTLEESLRG